MSTSELRTIHQIAESNVKAAHRAYTIALKNRKQKGDTEFAYETLLLANQVKDRIYQMLLKSITG